MRHLKKLTINFVYDNQDPNDVAFAADFYFICSALKSFSAGELEQFKQFIFNDCNR